MYGRFDMRLREITCKSIMFGFCFNVEDFFKLENLILRSTTWIFIHMTENQFTCVVYSIHDLIKLCIFKEIQIQKHSQHDL
jgi:hypothetical protein